MLCSCWLPPSSFPLFKNISAHLKELNLSRVIMASLSQLLQLPSCATCDDSPEPPMHQYFVPFIAITVIPSFYFSAALQLDTFQNYI